MAYRATSGEIRKECMQEELDYIFNRSDMPPIPFNSSQNSQTHELIEKSIYTNRTQLPIIHLEQSVYLIGTAFCELDIRDNGFGKQ